MIVAVAMAVFLMQNQAAILVSILSMTASQIRDVQDADIWVTEPDIECFDQVKPVRDMALHKVRGLVGVDWAVPMLKVDALARPQGGKLSTVTILGVDDSTLVGLPRKMRLGNATDIRQVDTTLIDPGGYALFFPGQTLQLGKTIRIHDRLLRIVGISDASPPFSGLPVLHTTRSVATAFNRGEERMTSFVLAKSSASANPSEVCDRIAAATGLRARTTEQFSHDSMVFYGNQGIPTLFIVTIAIGLVVGASITGQTFLMFVKENSRQLAMLKVVGTTGRQLGAMIASQAGLVLALGSCIGTGIASLVCELVRQQPFLRGLFLPWEIAVITVATLCLVTGGAIVISFRYVQSLEPATVFR
jgi:putative ABC transport system permease protein